MQFTSPLDVDLSPEVRAKTFRQRRVNAATSYAKWAAKQCAKNLIQQQETIFGLDAIANAGGEVGIAKSMATYQVYSPLRTYAAKIVVRLVKERLVR